MSDDVEAGAEVTTTTEWHGGALVVHVAGEVDMETSDDLRAAIVEALAAGPKALVLDLDGVTVFGSIGLSLLIEVRHRAEARKIGFAVATDRRAVLRPLTETGVIELLLLRADVAKAAEAALAAPSTA
ncbi:STAS domain-containing protein [Saccharothrix sp.]|uniref:STAS domain-containing protein n=1 Tax=Saccharothrix sp. TaxID=1873460 RepID=UPI002810E9C7|nr:STAS domain-containing protein [Saccharothrix sp.]